MFWKKKKKLKKKDEPSVHLTVIPEIFYGGADPLIYHGQKIQPPPKGRMSPSAQKAEKTKGKVRIKMSKKKLILIISIVAVVIIAGISWYYLRQAYLQNKALLEQQAAQKQQEKPAPKPSEAPPVIPPKSAPIEETTPPLEPAPPVTARPLSFPRILLKDSSDIDIDSLTDLEEELFNTDSGIWDSDQDGYYDGQEVFNLYNPTGFAPVRLIDSGLVREYINPNWQYRVYYPISWEAANVDPDNNHILFSSITGDFIEIRSIEKDASSSFDSWFAQNITGQRFADLSKFNNRFDIEGIKRKDNLAAYFVGNEVVFVIIYQPAGDAVDVPFRHVMQVMYQSFRPSELSADIPEQPILP